MKAKKIHVNKYIGKKARSTVYPVQPIQTAQTVRTIQADQAAQRTETSQADSLRNTGNSFACCEKAHAPKRGDIWFARLGNHNDTSVQSGIRPVLILSNNVSNSHSRTYNVLPMTSRIKREDLPPHVLLTAEDCCTTSGQMIETSIVLSEQITTLDRVNLLHCVSRIQSPQKLVEISRAVVGQLGL